MGNRCGRHAMRIEKQKARTTRLINRSTFRGYSLSYARTNGCHWAAWPVGIRLSSFGCFFLVFLESTLADSHRCVRSRRADPMSKTASKLSALPLRSVSPNNVSIARISCHFSWNTKIKWLKINSEPPILNFFSIFNVMPWYFLEDQVKGRKNTLSNTKNYDITMENKFTYHPWRYIRIL